MNWVERRYQDEQFLEANEERIWRDLCNALKASLKSYQERYNGTATCEEINGHQFRTAVDHPGLKNPALMDLKFSERRIEAMYSPQAVSERQELLLRADDLAPFSQLESLLTADQASQKLLEPLLFFKPKQVRVSVI